MTMSTDGYVEGLNYLYNHYAELNPLRLSLHFLNAGLEPPKIETACELGFGYGVSANLHAAASTTEWWGTDFNSLQAGFAREMASASGAAARFFDQSFADFCSRTDLPDFDFIGLHGLWSWISEKNRGIITEFVRRKLKSGGALYISYNTPPGDAAFTPIQEVLSRHAECMKASGQALSSRIGAALEFAERLLASSPLYAQASPAVAKRLHEIKNMDRSYLAHEYFNRSWRPTSFSDMTEWLAPANVEFACSASFFNTVDEWNLTTEQKALLDEIPEGSLRETARDFIVNQRCRRDYWMKGARRLTLQEKFESLQKQRMVLVKSRTDISVKAGGALGVFTPPKAICDPILDALADHQPHTFGQIAQAARDKGMRSAEFLGVMLTLFETGDLYPAQDEAVVDTARKQTDKLNAYLCDRARFDPTAPNILASPVIGTAMRADRVIQFFWHAARHGKRQPTDLVAHASQLFRAEGMTILDAEKPFLAPENSHPEAAARAMIFAEKILPILEALRIV
jgi:SAM-dependent methyltransferase